MKKNLYTLITVGIMLYSIPIFGQEKTVVPVAPGTGTLAAAIAAVEDKNVTIFELEREGVYIMEAELFANYLLHIRAAEGAGGRPIIAANGRRRFWTLSGNAEMLMEGIHLSLKTPDLFGVEATGTAIRLNGGNNKVTIDNCHLDYGDGEFFNLNSSNNSVFIKNSILSNLIRWAYPNNKGVVNLRSNPQDIVSIENSTLYFNGGTYFIAEGNSAPVNSLVFTHNTVYFSNFTTPFVLAKALNATVSNNIFYNFGIAADNTQQSPFFTATSLGDAGHNGVFDANRQFTLSNNNFYIQPEIADVITANRIEQHWDVRKHIFANAELPEKDTLFLLGLIANSQVDTTNNFSEPLNFKNPPTLPLVYFKEFVANNFQTLFDVEITQRPYADEDTTVYIPEATKNYDFSYNDNSRSATAATGGLWLGASMWIPYSTVSARNISQIDGFKVRAYPNPFFENLTFEIDAIVASNIRISVIDLTGKEVYAMNKNISQGNNRISADISSISQAGIYIYQVKIESPTGMKPVAMGKIIKK